MRLENTMFITTVRIPLDATHSDFFIYKIGKIKPFCYNLYLIAGTM